MSTNQPTETPERSNSSESQGGNRQRPHARKLPSVDEILDQLIRLNQALLLRVISPQDAGVIQKNLKTVLDVQLKRTSRGDSGETQEALVDLCRRDPRALEAVEPFLSQEQAQALMDEIMDNRDDSV